MDKDIDMDRYSWCTILVDIRHKHIYITNLFLRYFQRIRDSWRSGNIHNRYSFESGRIEYAGCRYLHTYV